jgi:hypothetical protein
MGVGVEAAVGRGNTDELAAADDPTGGLPVVGEHPTTPTTRMTAASPFSRRLIAYRLLPDRLTM